jgi:hypothetical protein
MKKTTSFFRFKKNKDFDGVKNITFNHIFMKKIEPSQLTINMIIINISWLKLNNITNKRTSIKNLIVNGNPRYRKTLISNNTPRKKFKCSKPYTLFVVLELNLL